MCSSSANWAPTSWTIERGPSYPDTAAGVEALLAAATTPEERGGRQRACQRRGCMAPTRRRRGQGALRRGGEPGRAPEQRGAKGGKRSCLPRSESTSSPSPWTRVSRAWDPWVRTRPGLSVKTVDEAVDRRGHLRGLRPRVADPREYGGVSLSLRGVPGLGDGAGARDAYAAADRDRGGAGEAPRGRAGPRARRCADARLGASTYRGWAHRDRSSGGPGVLRGTSTPRTHLHLAPCGMCVATCASAGPAAQCWRLRSCSRRSSVQRSSCFWLSPRDDALTLSPVHVAHRRPPRGAGRHGRAEVHVLAACAVLPLDTSWRRHWRQWLRSASPPRGSPSLSPTMPSSADGGLEELARELGPILLVCVVAVAPAIFEELAFRGLLQGRLCALMGRETGILVTAVFLRSGPRIHSGDADSHHAGRLPGLPPRPVRESPSGNAAALLLQRDAGAPRRSIDQDSIRPGEPLRRCMGNGPEGLSYHHVAATTSSRETPCRPPATSASCPMSPLADPPRPTKLASLR